MTQPAMTLTAEVMENTQKHNEVIKLTMEWANQMRERLPALETALRANKLAGVSPAQDLTQIRAALKVLFYFQPSEMVYYNEFSAKLADAIVTS